MRWFPTINKEDRSTSRTIEKREKTSPRQPEKILKERENNPSQYHNTSILDVGLLFHMRAQTSLKISCLVFT
jgi:hypothetical protein